jgi:hypothetical protein
VISEAAQFRQLLPVDDLDRRRTGRPWPASGSAALEDSSDACATRRRDNRMALCGQLPCEPHTLKPILIQYIQNLITKKYNTCGYRSVQSVN